jgi:hypothetical protein
MYNWEERGVYFCANFLFLNDSNTQSRNFSDFDAFGHKRIEGFRKLAIFEVFIVSLHVVTRKEVAQNI